MTPAQAQNLPQARRHETMVPIQPTPQHAGQSFPLAARARQKRCQLLILPATTTISRRQAKHAMLPLQLCLPLLVQLLKIWWPTLLLLLLLLEATGRWSSHRTRYRRNTAALDPAPAKHHPWGHSHSLSLSLMETWRWRRLLRIQRVVTLQARWMVVQRARGQLSRQHLRRA